MSSTETHKVISPLVAAAIALLRAAPGLSLLELNTSLFYLDLMSLLDFGETLTKSSFEANKTGLCVSEAETLECCLEDYASMPIATNKKLAKLSESALACLKEYSVTDNFGWLMAFKEPDSNQINMRIAMQQLVDDDPWLDEPLDEELQKNTDSCDSLITW